jgi:hypothetical protein
MAKQIYKHIFVAKIKKLLSLCFSNFITYSNALVHSSPHLPLYILYGKVSSITEFFKLLGIIQHLGIGH